MRWLNARRTQNDASDEIKVVTQQALDAARYAVNLDPRWKDRIHALMSKDDSMKAKEDDDLEVFSGNLDFRALVSR